jgi:hypothetical protein
MRLRVATLGLFTVAMIAPAAADAHSLVRSGGGLVSYLSEDATSLNTLTVRPDGTRIEFHDPTVDNGIDPGSCTPGQVSGGFIIQAFCPAGGVSRIRIDLRDREDTAVVSIPISVTLLGGSGADRLTAGPAGDEVDAGEGNDSVDGGDGDDTIDGGLGIDSLAGRAGADRLISRDGLADSVVCGEGADVVDADTFDEVAADCEEVTRTFTPPPSGGADEPGPPKLRVGAEIVQRPESSRRVRVFAASSEPGTISASGFLNVAGLNRPVQAESRRVEVGGAGGAIGYKVAPKRWDEVARALRRGRPVSVHLGVVATDLAGNSSRRNAPRVRLALRGAKADGGKGGTRPFALNRHPEPGDTDGDEVWDFPPYPPPYDNCPTVKNGSQINTDMTLNGNMAYTPNEPAPAPPEPAPSTPMPAGDAAGDACDADDDADGVADTEDNCRVDRNPAQLDEDEFPGYGDVCVPVDDDGDGLVNDDDNCDLVPNPDQADLDGDDRGDVCDRDDDGDGLDDPFDKCPTVYDPPVSDVDGDGEVTWRDQPDADGDGIGTACDPEEPVLRPDAPGQDTTPPDARARARTPQPLAQLSAGVIVSIRCSEACTATSELVLSRTTAKRIGLGRDRTIAEGAAELDGAGKTYAFVRADRRARNALAGAGGAIRARLVTGVVDPGANARRLSRRLEISPR